MTTRRVRDAGGSYVLGADIRLLIQFARLCHFFLALEGCSWGRIGGLARGSFSTRATNARRAAATPFGLRARACFSTRAANSRSPASVRVTFRGARAAVGGSVR